MKFFEKMFNFDRVKGMAKKINILNDELSTRDAKLKVYSNKITNLEKDINRLKKEMVFMSVVLSQSGTRWKIKNKDGKEIETDESFMKKYKDEISSCMKEYHIDTCKTNSAPSGGVVKPYKNTTHTYTLYNADPSRKIENTYLVFDNGACIYTNRSICEFVSFDSIYDNLVFTLDKYHHNSESVAPDFAYQCNYIIANEDKMLDDRIRIKGDRSITNWAQLFYNDDQQDSILVECVKIYIDYILKLYEDSIEYENDLEKLKKFWTAHKEVNECNALNLIILAFTMNPFEFQVIMGYDDEELIAVTNALRHGFSRRYSVFTKDDILDYRDLYVNIINDMNDGNITEQDIHYIDMNSVVNDPISHAFGIDDDVDESVQNSSKEYKKKESEEDTKSVVSLEVKTRDKKKMVTVHCKMTDSACKILNLRGLVRRFCKVMDLDYSKVSGINYEHLTLDDIRKNKIFNQIKSYIKFVIVDCTTPQRISLDSKSRMLYDKKLVDRIKTLIQTEPFMFLFCFKFTRMEAIDLIIDVDQYDFMQQLQNTFNLTNIEDCVQEYENITGQVAFYADTESNEKKFIKEKKDDKKNQQASMIPNGMMMPIGTPQFIAIDEESFEENQKMAKKYNDMMTIAKYLQNNQHIASELYRLILKDRIKEKGVIKSDNDTIEEWLDSFDDGWKNNSY